MSSSDYSHTPLDDLDLGVTVRGLRVGQKVLGRYTLKKILGRGGMGVVWLARDEALDRDIAFKFLPEMVSHDRSAVDDIKREARRSLELTHANIVRIYDFVNDDQCAGITMEYIDGDTLSNLRTERPNKVFEAVELQVWVRQLCAALCYAHEDAELVHRDLKPANLMVNKQGKLKVADFGISRSVSNTITRVTLHQGAAGTPVYMSPQQAMGEPPSVADDIYSFGATIYELLTSKPPFYTGDISAQVREKIPVAMAQRRKELNVAGQPIPRRWEDVITACLAKKAEERPSSAAEILDLLGVAETRGGARSTTSPPMPVRPTEAPTDEEEEEEDEGDTPAPTPRPTKSTKKPAPPKTKVTGPNTRKRPMPRDIEPEEEEYEAAGGAGGKKALWVTVGVILLISIGIGGWKGFFQPPQKDSSVARGGPAQIEEDPIVTAAKKAAEKAVADAYAEAAENKKKADEAEKRRQDGVKQLAALEELQKQEKAKQAALAEAEKKGREEAEAQAKRLAEELARSEGQKKANIVKAQQEAEAARMTEEAANRKREADRKKQDAEMQRQVAEATAKTKAAEEQQKEAERRAAESKRLAEEADRKLKFRATLVVNALVGSQVSVDGRSYPKLPATVTGLKLGDKPRIRVQLAGYEDYEFEAEVKDVPGKTSNTITNDIQLAQLVRSTGQLELKARQSGVKYTLTGPDKFPDKTTSSGVAGGSLKVNTGTYQVRYERDNWNTNRTVTVEKGKAIDVNMDLPYGSLEIETDPPGAIVFFMGKNIGTTPLSKPEIDLVSGTYELKREGFRPVTGNLAINLQQPTKVSARLVPLAGPGKGQPWTNSLGMRFIPVGDGKTLFCIWETRVKDYELFKNATGNSGGTGWPPVTRDAYIDKKGNIIQEEFEAAKQAWESRGHHPVANVSWNDAKAFCDWLTKLEQKDEKVPQRFRLEAQSYRLPTDAEWSLANGLNETGNTPKERDSKIRGVFPWGKQWPPPLGAGNYDEFISFDHFERTSPVGSFKPNALGIYDLGGNVWEWCQDEIAPGAKTKVLRGAAFGTLPEFLNVSYREDFAPEDRRASNGDVGFRVVLDVGER
jgi:serine/threonine protein kinase